jgi:hypothetical protein
MCGSGARWCARADAISDVPDMHVLDVEIDDQRRLVLTIERVSWRPPVRHAGCWLSATAGESGSCMTRRAWGGSLSCGGWCGCGAAETAVPDDNLH